MTKVGAREITLCEFNLENLFVSMPYYDGQDLQSLSEIEWRNLALAQLKQKQKSLTKLFGVAKAIRDINPDILLLVEVGGEESLENFNRHFLGNEYVVYFVEGNSRRNIDLGFLVRKNLGYQIDVRSNRDTLIEVLSWRRKYTSKFSRDVAELRLQDETGLKLILLLTHLKSKISTEDDIKGQNVRTAEAIGLAKMYEERKAEFPHVPVIVGGDFNAELASIELEMLRHTDLVDFRELIGKSAEENVSLVHFDYAQSPHAEVLDYLLMSPHLHDRIVPEKCYTYRYKGFYDIPDFLPETLKERYQMPSDHFPLALTLKL